MSEPVSKPFVAAHAQRTATLRLAAPPEQTFPLFTPLGEKLWTPEWNPQPYYPPSGEPEIGAVFVTQHPHEPVSVWVMAQYDPEQLLVSYARVTPGVTAALIQVQCRASDDGTTLATVTYTLTALDVAGVERLAAFTETHYHHWMAEWETAINEYLESNSGQ